MQACPVVSARYDEANMAFPSTLCHNHGFPYHNISPNKGYIVWQQFTKTGNKCWLTDYVQVFIWPRYYGLETGNTVISIAVC